MKINTFNTIKRRFSVYSSFAVWNDRDINDLKIIGSCLEELHGRLIFIGYNASAQVKRFENFHKRHKGGRDAWLAKTIGVNPIFRGAYLTDFFKGDFASRENSVMVNKIIIAKNKKILEEEIGILGPAKHVLVAVGKKAEKILNDCGFQCERIPHYAGHISFKEFRIAINALEKKMNQ